MGTPSFAKISYTVAEAVTATSISEDTIRTAIADGALVAHYVGAKASKPVLRAVDIDEWIASLPTERGGSR